MRNEAKILAAAGGAGCVTSKEVSRGGLSAAPGIKGNRKATRRLLPFSARWEFARAAGSHALARANFFEGRLQ
jgi:hypothetical protein